MGPTGRLPAMMTNTTRRQDLTVLPDTGRLPARVERSISRIRFRDGRRCSGFVVSLSRRCHSLELARIWNARWLCLCRINHHPP